MKILKLIREYRAKRERRRVIAAKVASLECAMTAVARAVHPYLTKEQITACLDRIRELEKEKAALLRG